MDEEIEKLVERTENAETFEDDSSILRQNDNKIDPNTRLESRSDKESPEVPLYVAQGLIMERQQSHTNVEKMIADVIQQECENLRLQISLQIHNATTNHIPSQVGSSVKKYMSGHILDMHLTQATPASAQEQQYHTPYRPSSIRPKDQDDPHDDAYPEGENSAKRQKTTSEHGTYVFGESSSGQVNESKPCPSTSSNQEQLDDFDFWTNSYALDDDELPNEKVLQELVD
ncbi:hypothetical protein Tco_0849280, partial [Tanacetum coccineum]